MEDVIYWPVANFCARLEHCPDQFSPAFSGKSWTCSSSESGSDMVGNDINMTCAKSSSFLIADVKLACSHKFSSDSLNCEQRCNGRDAEEWEFK